MSSDDEGGKEVELSDDPFDCVRLSVENVPCIVTLCKVSRCSQVKSVVVNATVCEEWLSLSRWATDT